MRTEGRVISKGPTMQLETGSQFLCLLVISLFVIAAEVASSETSTVNPFVSFSEGRLRIRAVEVSLEDLVQEIRKKSGIVVELRDQEAAEKQLTLEVNDLSPSLAFEGILRGFSFVFFYDRARLAQVVVLSPDGPPPQLSLSRSAPGPQPSTAKPPGSNPTPDFEQMLKRSRAEGMRALSEALASSNPDVKSSALEVLTEQEGPDVIPILGRALRDPDPSFRIEVLEALADKGELQVVKSALSDQNNEVRERAAELLEIEREGK